MRNYLKDNMHKIKVFLFYNMYVFKFRYRIYIIFKTGQNIPNYVKILN